MPKNKKKQNIDFKGILDFHEIYENEKSMIFHEIFIIFHEFHEVLILI